MNAPPVQTRSGGRSLVDLLELEMLSDTRDVQVAVRKRHFPPRSRQERYAGCTAEESLSQDIEMDSSGGIDPSVPGSMEVDDGPTEKYWPSGGDSAAEDGSATEEYTLNENCMPEKGAE